MAAQHQDPEPHSFLALSEPDFKARLAKYSKPKARSQSTYDTIHLPELNHRLSLNLPLPSAPDTPSNQSNPYAPHPDLTTTLPIHAIYLGTSMLERVKNTGSATRLAALPTSWNAGCGGDKNENVLFRFGLGMYDILHSYSLANPDAIKAWVLSAGTNNLHAEKGMKEEEVQAWRVLVEACLKIAPASRVLACDVFYRKDIPDAVVEEVNGRLEQVVDAVNAEVREERVLWVEARQVLDKGMLVDHVHLDETGYKIWDEVLWPYVERGLEAEKN